MFRYMYPLNVHAATNGTSGKGSALQTKKIAAVFALIVLSIFITILSYVGGSKYHFGILAAFLGFILSIILDVYLYNVMLRDKFNESFESDSDNKIFRLFRIRMSDNDTERLSNNVEPVFYTSGEVGITLHIEIGNITASSENATEDFLDRLFVASHQLGLKIKMYSIPTEWRKSKVYHNHLMRLSKVADNKLRSKLSLIDAHQAKIFEKSKVPSIQINFYTKRTDMNKLNGLIHFVSNWKNDNMHMASMREMDWLTKDETIEVTCQFLGLKMLDITRNLTKKNIKYDIRRLVRVYSKDRFHSADVGIESDAVLIRRHKQ